MRKTLKIAPFVIRRRSACIPNLDTLACQDANGNLASVEAARIRFEKRRRAMILPKQLAPVLRASSYPVSLGQMIAIAPNALTTVCAGGKLKILRGGKPYDTNLACISPGQVTVPNPLGSVHSAGLIDDCN